MIDIITNDISGQIQIFYGGSSADGAYYLSNNLFNCDAQWEERQENQKHLVKQMGIALDPSIAVADGSMIRWKGLYAPAVPTQATDPNYQHPLVTDELQDVLLGSDTGGAPDVSAFDPQ